ncbi:MAG: PAS domain S-box protein [Chitinispirillaceae bacterium]|nr:PAS domain S-box protein [Chitinispirillaceae bacterium]
MDNRTRNAMPALNTGAKHRPHSILFVWLSMILLATGVASTTLTVLLVFYRTTDVIATADARLLIAAEMSREIIGPDYHERIDDRSSIAREEFDRIVQRNDDLCRRLGLQYLWSVLEVDGRLVFTTAAHSDIEDPSSPCASFFDTHNNPEAFAPALRHGRKPTFSSFRNEWGEGRMVLVPRKDSRGRTYIFGASLQLAEYNALVRHALLTALAIGLLVMGLAFLLAMLLARYLTLPIARLTEAANLMASGNLDAPLPSGGTVELQSLSHSFGRMRQELQGQMGALHAEKEHLAVTLRSIGDGVITTDTNGDIVMLNKSAEELTGWNHGEAVGRPLSNVFKIINEITRQTCENTVDKVLETGSIVELANHTCLIAKDGREIVIADSAAPIKDLEGATIGVVLVFRDMTEKQKMHDAMQMASKLESLGVLAGGIAHDFNNLLGGIYGYIDIANEETREQNVSGFLAKALGTIDRARGLTRQLLTFAKGGAPIRRIDKLFPFMQETAVFALSGSSVSCRFDLPKNLWNCNYDRNQIGQVIDNIIINAQQAMPEGGIIEISATNVSFGEKEHPTLSSGHYVKVSIKDHGVGIKKELLSRIFDPFYTTKLQGHGLGLATCYSIVNQHGGCIEVASQPGEGSVFDVYLPASDDSLPAATGEASAEKHRGTGTFVVMDDEKVICETIGAMLASLGYSVVSKQNGKEAVEFFAREIKAERKIAGMIFDLTIPGGMGGKEAIGEIRKWCSKTPVFVASGYAEDPVMSHPTEYGFTASLSKPFKKTELVTMLNRYLKTEE